MKFAAFGEWFGKDFYENVRLAAEYGFKGVEQYEWLGLDLDRAGRTLEEYGMTSTALLIQTRVPDDMQKLKWCHGMVWEDARLPFLSAFRETAEAAHKMNVKNIIATVGNRRYDISGEEQFAICCRTLLELTEIAQDEGLTIVLEPLNDTVDHKGHYLVKTEEAVKMIHFVDSPHLKLLYDIYHQQISEGNVTSTILRNIKLIGHMHIADVPGRKQPGTGELNYRNIFEAISKTDYDGWLTFECGSTVDTPTLCRDMRELIAPFSD